MIVHASTTDDTAWSRRPIYHICFIFKYVIQKKISIILTTLLSHVSSETKICSRIIVIVKSSITAVTCYSGCSVWLPFSNGRCVNIDGCSERQILSSILVTFSRMIHYMPKDIYLLHFT